jgi:hypothetical protein
MLLTAYAYSLYKDKIRQTPPELYRLESAKPSTDAGTGADPNESNGYYLYAFMFELFCLFFTLPLALRLSRSRGEMVAHLFFAIFLAPFYLFIAVGGQIVRYTLAGGSVY